MRETRPTVTLARSLLAALLAATACSTSRVRPLDLASPSQMPPDEQRLWNMSRDVQRRIDESGVAYRDERLRTYLQEVAEKLLASRSPSAKLTPCVKVIRDPFLNAFALPHGAIYLHTGILARMDDEAQLASVLGHELTHFTHRHGLRETRAAKRNQFWADVFQTGIALAGTAFGGQPLGMAMVQLGGDAAGLWALASVRGYSRDLEREADAVGLQALVGAGYDPRAALEVFAHLQEELDAAAVKEPYFFGTHPRLQERADTYRRLLETEYAARVSAGGRRGTDEFLDATSSVLLDNALYDLELGRPRTARAAIDKHLRRRPESARGHFVLGEFQRRSGQVPLALAEYKEAARLDPAYPDPHRELGLIYREQRRRSEARAALERYLALAPAAIDARLMRAYLAELER